jgi:beta-galactosidase
MDFQTYASGVIDYFRLPKFSYYLFQSQRDPHLKIDGINSGPMIFIANYWTENSPKDVKVFSNCDSVRLLLNAELIGTRPPDQNSISDHLLHPPFTFSNLPWMPGELKALGFLDGKEIVQYVRQTPEKGYAIELRSEINDLPRADGKDLFFVYASIVDQNGTIVPFAEDWIDFEVEGVAKLVSPNRIQAEAGIGAALIRVSQQPGMITVRATNPELKGAIKTIICH